MSLINEALKRAEELDRNENTPAEKLSVHNIEHLYGDQAGGEPAPSTRATEGISQLLQKNRTSLRGASVLGICVIASVAVIMHLTLPPEQRAPIEAKAGLRRAQSSRKQKHDTRPVASEFEPLTASLAKWIIDSGQGRSPAGRDDRRSQMFHHRRKATIR